MSFAGSTAMMSESVSMMISFAHCSLVDGDALPLKRFRNVLVPWPRGRPFRHYRGGHQGLCHALPAAIGARVPEAYGAIMEPIPRYGNSAEALPPAIPS